jgi:hypothetical protein
MRQAGADTPQARPAAASHVQILDASGWSGVQNLDAIAVHRN